MGYNVSPGIDALYVPELQHINIILKYTIMAINVEIIALSVAIVLIDLFSWESDLFIYKNM